MKYESKEREEEVGGRWRGERNITSEREKTSERERDLS